MPVLENYNSYMGLESGVDITYPPGTHTITMSTVLIYVNI